MFIIYLDESGHPDARHFVLAGVALFETDTYFLAQELDALQLKYLPESLEPVPFHASVLRNGSGQRNDPYPTLGASARRQMCSEVYEVIGRSPVQIFAVVIEKGLSARDPYEQAFEELVSRFDRMLQRRYRQTGSAQRGLMIAAESSYRQNLERLARKISREGTQWGPTRNLADIPYFAPAASTRLLQAADFVANAVFARFESGYARDFDRLVARFDRDEDDVHGLVHRHAERFECFCPACISWRARQRRPSSRQGAEI